MEKKKDVFPRKPRSLSLQLARKEDLPFSPALGKMGGVSPMTSLSLNMGGLMCDGNTPKRRLSLSSTGDTPVSSRASSQSSDHVGFFLGSPSAEDSPFLEQAPSAFRRFNSMPGQHLSSLNPVASLAKELEEEAGVGGGNECPATEGSSSSSSDEAPGADVVVAGRDRAETIMWEACNDQENIDVQDKINNYQASRPRLISFLDCPAKERPISAPASLLEQSSKPQTIVVNSPVKLQQCQLASSNDDEEEDGFTNIFAAEASEASGGSTSGEFSSLMSAPFLLTSPPTPTGGAVASPSTALRDLDCNALEDTPGPKCRRGIFKVPSHPVLRRGSFLKRPDRPRDTPSPVQSKRYRSCSVAVCPVDMDREAMSIQTNKSPRARPLSRSHSMDDTTEYHARIARTLMPNVDCTKLTGDLRKSYALPVCKGKHQDLQSITPETLCRVLRSEVKEVQEYHILDCRYPYEFEGGHIKDAVNLYTRAMVEAHFLKEPKAPLDGRVLIFHCEFSSKRGPDLLRFLRNKDREANSDRYPALHYPELYILYGGYKAFYEYDKTMCEPQTYTPMDLEVYRKQCLHFKAKAKSWAGERSRIGHRKTSVS